MYITPLPPAYPEPNEALDAIERGVTSWGANGSIKITRMPHEADILVTYAADDDEMKRRLDKETEKIILPMRATSCENSQAAFFAPSSLEAGAAYQMGLAMGVPQDDPRMLETIERARRLEWIVPCIIEQNEIRLPVGGILRLSIDQRVTGLMGYSFRDAHGQDIHVCALRGYACTLNEGVVSVETSPFELGVQCPGPLDCDIAYRISRGNTPPDAPSIGSQAAA